MKRCWARVIGQCGGGKSGEHLISKSQFTRPVIDVEGFPWLNGERKTIGLPSLVANNLCRDHNSALSDVDTEAMRFLDGLREVDRITAALKAGARRPRRVFKIDADKFERWLLKTTFNLALQVDRNPRGLYVSGDPDPSLVRIAFGLAQFEEPDGLYRLASEGERVGGKIGTVEWQPIMTKTKSCIIAAGLRFHGHRFLLTLPGAPDETREVRTVSGAYRMERMRVAETSCEVQLVWNKQRRRARRRGG